FLCFYYFIPLSPPDIYPFALHDALPIWYQVVRVPYTAGLTAMYIVLPDSGVRAAALLEHLGQAGWPKPDPRTESRPVQIRLPRLDRKSTRLNSSRLVISYAVISLKTEEK